MNTFFNFHDIKERNQYCPPGAYTILSQGWDGYEKYFVVATLQNFVNREQAKEIFELLKKGETDTHSIGYRNLKMVFRSLALWASGCSEEDENQYIQIE